MNINNLIGMKVTRNNDRATGEIKFIRDRLIGIDFYGTIHKYAYPAAFSNRLELEDEMLQEEIQNEGAIDSFEQFKKSYRRAINNEIDYLKSTGGKKYKIIDGEKLQSKNGEYLYAFDTDTDLYFPDGTAIKLWFPDNIIPAYVVSCEDFTLIIRTMEYIGEKIESVEFTSEQWQLLEALMERLEEMNLGINSIAYQIACNGRRQITNRQSISRGQNAALNRATSEEITFIWGPPGTGKTETLANIALEHIKHGRRVLMLSYSNVSVDGALMRVANKAGLQMGTVIRYGHPRTKELLESKTLTSYQCVLRKNPDKAEKYQKLIETKRKLNRKDPARLNVNKELNKIRDYLLDQEKRLVYSASFVATTVSKATVDSAIHKQRFDVVIFDEASMAYVPQIIFSACLAKDYFVCMGDFRQLPAIVQNKEDDKLTGDIFEYTGITQAVENNYGHEWMVMLDMQYRMHQDIADFVSKHMYEGLLKTYDKIVYSREEIAACNPCSTSAMSLIDLSGMYSVCTKTMDGSRINILSALICLRLAEVNIGKNEVGIITPYSAQSRLILAMIRDIQEYDKRWLNVSCATVHQFQGSEKPIIVYDAVDCFRMPYPGMLLTSLKNNTANRLFNVAITRAKGKFIMVANVNYLRRKHISKDLIFTEALKQIQKEGHDISGGYVLDEMMPREQEEPIVFVEDRKRSWKDFLADLDGAKSVIHIDIPDVIDENEEAIAELVKTLDCRKEEGVDICIRLSEDIDLPEELTEYIQHFEYVTTPVTLIDKRIVWFGQPLYAADFISEGDILDTEYFPCVRFVGTHTARSIQGFLEM